jgi:hypothetical protein
VRSLILRGYGKHVGDRTGRGRYAEQKVRPDAGLEIAGRPDASLVETKIISYVHAYVYVHLNYLFFANTHECAYLCIRKIEVQKLQEWTCLARPDP